MQREPRQPHARESVAPTLRPRFLDRFVASNLTGYGAPESGTSQSIGGSRQPSLTSMAPATITGQNPIETTEYATSPNA